MKKGQALNLWKQLKNSTYMKGTISGLANREGYPGERTMERYAQAADSFKARLSSGKVAGKTGWSLKYVNKIREWWEEEFLPRRVKHPVAHFDMAKHSHDLLDAVIPELLGIDVFQPRDSALATFYSRPDEPYWPIARGRVSRTGSHLAIHLAVEDRLEFTYLRQHLKDDAVWATLDAWKEAMAVDITARFCLLGKIIDGIRSEIGLPILSDPEGANRATDGIGIHYAYTIYDQVFSRALGIRVETKRREEFALETAHISRLSGHVVIRSQDIYTYVKALDYLLEAQVSLTGLSETKAAKQAYEKAIEKTADVKRQVERIRLLVSFPPGSICDGCSPANERTAGN